MPFDVDAFRAATSPARSAHYEVLIIPPFNITASISLDSDVSLKYKTQVCELPGRILQTFEDRAKPGPQAKVVNGSIYNDVSIQIQVNEAWKEREWFQTWQSYAVNDIEYGPGSGDLNHLVRYYDDYVGNVEITTFDVLGMPRYRVTLVEAYPTVVGNIALSWDSSNDVANFQVEFAYRYFSTERL